MPTTEKRHRERFELARLAFIRSSKDATTVGGVLDNISPDGASVVFHGPNDDLEALLPAGLRIDLVIDDFPALTGEVVRNEPDRVAISFGLESRAQNELLRHILEVTAADYEDASLAGVIGEKPV
ncbi:MAG: PilZ domain-containing protein [Rhodospirillales bacterium]